MAVNHALNTVYSLNIFELYEVVTWTSVDWLEMKYSGIHQRVVLQALI